MSISAGTKLGRYEIRSQIGEGGMGEVYLAQDTKLDRKVALKILPAEVASHRDRMERFVRSALFAARRGWTGESACRGDCPSRSETRQHHGHARWSREDSRFWFSEID